MSEKKAQDRINAASQSVSANEAIPATPAKKVSAVEAIGESLIFLS